METAAPTAGTPRRATGAATGGGRRPSPGPCCNCSRPTSARGFRYGRRRRCGWPRRPRVTQAPLGGRAAESSTAAPAVQAGAGRAGRAGDAGRAGRRPQPVDAAIVLAAERRLEDLSRRLNDVEHRAEGERRAALQRLAETEQQLVDARRQAAQAERLVDAADARVAAAEQRAAEYEYAHGTLRHAHSDLAQRHDDAIRELDTAVGLLAEEVGRREDFEQRAHSATSLLEAERRAKQDIVQQSNIEHQALTARLKSVEKRLADAVQQASAERAEHRQLLERAQGALTAEAQARTATEDQLAEMTRAAEVLQAQQTAEISRLNMALQAAIDRRVEFEARIAEMEAGIRAQRDAEARSWVGAEQRLAETIAALESERVRGEQWRRQTASDVQQQLREALGELSAGSGKHSDTGRTPGRPPTGRARGASPADRRKVTLRTRFGTRRNRCRTRMVRLQVMAVGCHALKASDHPRPRR